MSRRNFKRNKSGEWQSPQLAVRVTCSANGALNPMALECSGEAIRR